jgi:hypothetical protein
MVAAIVTSARPAGIAMKNPYVCSQPRMRGLPMSTARSRRGPASGVETSDRLLTHARLRRTGKLPAANDPAEARRVPAVPPTRRPIPQIRPVGAASPLLYLPRLFTWLHSSSPVAGKSA